MIRETEERIAGYQQQLLAQFEDIFPFDGGTETWWAG
jgi:hypothetical protein